MHSVRSSCQDAPINSEFLPAAARRTYRYCVKAGMCSQSNSFTPTQLSAMKITNILILSPERNECKDKIHHKFKGDRYLTNRVRGYVLVLGISTDRRKKKYQEFCDYNFTLYEALLTLCRNNFVHFQWYMSNIKRTLLKTKSL